MYNTYLLPLAFRLLRSLEVIECETDGWGTYDRLRPTITDE